jgi:hypothetical protein
MSSLSGADQLTVATRLKDTGNSLFAQRQLSAAVEVYSKAIDILREQQIQEENDRINHRYHDHQNYEKDLLLYAVLCSNRSACYYELGNFNMSALDAQTCMDYLDDLLRMQHKFEHTLAHTPVLSPADEAKAVKMRSSNQWRRTRALLYQHDGDLQQAQARLDAISLKDNGQEDKIESNAKLDGGTNEKQVSQSTHTADVDVDALPPGIFPNTYQEEMEEGPSLLQEILSRNSSHGDTAAATATPSDNTLIVRGFLVPHISDKEYYTSKTKLLLDLAALAVSLNTAIQNVNYLWQQGGDGPIFGVHVETTQKKKRLPHIQAACQYGVTVADAWTLVDMLCQFSKQNPHVVFEFWDVDDGHILCIEAAEVLPAWAADPAVMVHRCYLRQGRVVLVAPTKHGTTRQEVLALLCENSPNICQSFASVDAAIKARLANTRQQQAIVQRAAVALPVQVAHFFHKRPEVLTLAVTAWAEHLSKLRSSVTKDMPQRSSPIMSSSSQRLPLQWQWTVQHLPRVSYAQLRTLTGAPPQNSESDDWTISDNVPSRFLQGNPSLRRLQRQQQQQVYLKHAVAIGVRLVAGLEFLWLQSQSNPTPPSGILPSPMEERILHYWAGIVAAVEFCTKSDEDNNNWVIKAWQAGPQQAEHSLENILKCPVYHPEVQKYPYPLSFPLESLNHVLQSTWRQCPDDEPCGNGNNPPDRHDVDDADDSWLNISEAKHLSAAIVPPKSEESHEKMQQVLHDFQTFMTGESDVEGVSHVASTSFLKETTQSSPPVVNAGRSENRDDNSLMRIRPGVVLHLLRETLAAPTESDLLNFLQQPMQKADLYFSPEDYDLMEASDNSDNEEDDIHKILKSDEEMMATMEQMDQELLGNANLSRAMDPIEVEGQVIDDDRMKTDAHVVAHLVESMHASGGGPGPVQNILVELSDSKADSTESG